MHENRTTYPTPKYSKAAPPHRISGQILRYCRKWDEPVVVKPAGDENGGHTFYPKGVPRQVAAVGVQPGRLYVDPTVKNCIRERPPSVIREGLEDGWLTQMQDTNDNYKSSFRAKAPLGPVLTPPQVEAIRISLEMAKRASLGH